MLRKTNDDLSKLHNEVVSTLNINETEITEALCFWCNNNVKKCIEVWGEEGTTFSCLLEEIGISEFTRRYKEYKQKKKEKDEEIKVGDEVYLFNSSYKHVVIYIDVEADIANIISSSGNNTTVSPSILHKTGKHYDIKSILNQLKE